MSEAEGVAMATGATVAFREDGSWQKKKKPQAAHRRGAGEETQAGQVAQMKMEHERRWGSERRLVIIRGEKNTVMTWNINPDCV